MFVFDVAGRLILVVIVAAGLWPHFATPASWLTAGVFAGAVFCVLKSYGSRAVRLWGAALGGVVLWLLRARSSLSVYPEQLLPRIETQSISTFSLVSMIIACGIVLILCRRFSSKWRIVMLLGLAILVHLISSMIVGETIRRLSRWEPADYSYNFDGIRYLKSYYLMKDGRDWYQACVESTRVDARAPFNVPRVVMNYRLPTLYVLFSLLPRGDWIQVLFILLSCCAMVCTFDLVRVVLRRTGVDSRDIGVYALASAVVLSPYLMLGAVTWFYTFHEYWALFASIGALWLLARRQISLAVLLAVLAACVREHFLLVTLVVSVLGWLRGCPKERTAIVGSWCLLLIVYIVHVYRALPYTGQGMEEGASIWLHTPSLRSILYTTFFGMTLYPLSKMTVPPLFALALYGLWRGRSEILLSGLSLLIIVPVIGYFFVGPQIPSGGYWGVLYMPWVLIAGSLGIAGWSQSTIRSGPSG